MTKIFSLFFTAVAIPAATFICSSSSLLSNSENVGKQGEVVWEGQEGASLTNSVSTSVETKKGKKTKVKTKNKNSSNKKQQDSKPKETPKPKTPYVSNVQDFDYR